MEKTTRNRIGCLALIFVPVILFFVFAIANRPSPEEKATNDARAEQLSAAFACQDAVRERLKAPATADFQAPRDARIELFEDGSYKISSYVDAQNSFGAKIRNTYTCQVAKGRNGREGFVVLDVQLSAR